MRSLITKTAFLLIFSILVGVEVFASVETSNRLPDGMTNYEEIRKRGYVYVDKTRFMQKMLQTGFPFHFLARPKKFGKSLLCRTLESALWGRKEFFKDTAIYRSSFDWKVSPVVFLDFSSFGLDSETPHQYRTQIVRNLQKIPARILTERKFRWYKPPKILVRIQADSHNDSAVCESLTNLVYSLSRAFSSPVSIIIDNYDEAITWNLRNHELCDAIGRILKAFYACVTSLETKLRFVFITGVARFTRSYLFSSMASLNDISSREEYSEVLGFTSEEMEHFVPEVEEIVRKKKAEGMANVTRASEDEVLRDLFHGYKFTRNGPAVYHPSFLIKYLTTKEHDAHEIQRPEPRSLFELLPVREHYRPLLVGLNASESDLRGVLDPKDVDVKTLLFQTGIFTIKEYDRESGTLFLHYPNNYTAEDFREKIFKRLMEPLNLNINFRSFADRCDKMMGDLLTGDDTHVQAYFDQLDNILAVRRGEYSFAEKQPSNVLPTTEGKTKEDNYYFAIESAFQNMMRICLDITKFGHVVADEKILSNGRGGAYFVVEIPMKRCEIMFYLTEARRYSDSGCTVKSLVQLLEQYYTGVYPNGTHVIAIGVSFRKEKPGIDESTYVIYNEKGERIKFSVYDKGCRIDDRKMYRYKFQLPTSL